MSADGIVLQVEPQEKKKTPKGRAKKRITYTRRFVNVTLTGGKRKVHLTTSPPYSSYLQTHLDEPKPNRISAQHSPWETTAFERRTEDPTIRSEDDVQTFRNRRDEMFGRLRKRWKWMMIRILDGRNGNGFFGRMELHLRDVSLFVHFANKNAFPAHMCVMVNGNLDLLPFSLILLFVAVCLLVNLRAS
jgi:hypothetical protein